MQRKQRPLVVWHGDCVRAAIDNYRRWRRGGVGNMLMQNRTNDDAPHSTTTMPNTDASIDISTRRDFWWSTLLTRAYRNMAETREKKVHLLAPTEWGNLEARMHLAMQTATQSCSIKYLVQESTKTHKTADVQNCLKECNTIIRCIQPAIHSEGSTKKRKRMRTPALTHYQLSRTLVA